MDATRKNTSVFLDGAFPHVGDLSHAETRRGGEFFSRKKRKDHKAGGPTSVSATIDRSGWKRVRLGDVCTIKARIGWQGLKKSEYLDSGNYCLVSGTDFRNGFVNWNTCSFVSKWRYNQDTNIQLKNGDVLITKDGTIGKVAYVHGMACPTTLNSGIFVIRPTATKLHPAFLQLIFKSRFFTDFLDRITAGSTIVHLYQKDIVDFDLPIPNDNTQLKIVDAIQSIDKSIDNQEAIIAKYEAIKKATVNLLLKPTGTHMVKLGEVADISRGGSPRPIQDYITADIDGINWIKIGDVSVDAKYIEQTEERIKPTGVAMSRQVKAGDFILSNSMSFGRPYILKIDGCIHDGWLAIQNYQNTFDVDYLYYLLGSDMVFAQYIENAAGSSVKNLNKDIVAKITLPSPPLSEQCKIAEQITAIDKVLADYKAQLEKARQLKAGMMSYFFG